MIEFFLYIFIFALLYSLSSKIQNLRHELFILKKNLSKKELSIKGTISFTKQVQEPELQLEPLVTQRKVTSTTPTSKTPQKKKQVTPTKNENPVFDYIKNYFTTGNIVVRVGGIILFFGLAFLAKYASDNSMISIEFRLMALVLFSFILTTIGWKLREREGYYGLILQGLGIGVFYLVVFVSTKLYALLSPDIAFLIMLSIVIFGSLLAIVQNALPLAIFSIGGGFLAPILTSDGSGSHIILFSYYTLLNSAIVGIAWYHSWRVLNLMGFIFTFVIASSWGVLSYKPELFWTTEPFLILFFLFYLSVSILFTYKQSFNAKGVVDATLVFGVPLIAFSIQVSLASPFENALAISAISMGSLYLLLYKILSSNKNMQLLSSSFLYLSIIFYTISVPYFFDAQITSALWVLESCAIIFVSLKQNRFLSRVTGEILQVVATLIYIVSSLEHTTLSAFLNSFYLGYVIITLASFFTAYTLYANQEKLSKFDKKSPLLFLVIALFVLLFSGFRESFNISLPMGNAMLIYIGIATFILALVAHKLNWTLLIKTLQGYLILGLLLFVSLLSFYEVSHPFGEFGVVAIFIFFTVNYFLLYVYDEKWQHQDDLHILTLWMLTLIGAKELSYAFSLFSNNSTYNYIAWGLFFSIVLLAILKIEKLLPTQFTKYAQSYRSKGAIGLIVMLSVWEISSISLSGNPTPVPYIPLLNPIEMVELLGIFLIYKHLQNLPKIYAYISPLLLVFSTLVLARSIHFFIGVDYTLLSLSHSMVFQMSLSILWSLIAMFVMIKANSLQHRVMWIMGASLIGVVVAKLFLVELANSGSVERIISFIAVGLLLLLIGYFAPLPPVKKNITTKETTN